MRPAQTNARILIIDDDPMVHRVLRQALQDEYEVTVADSCVDLPAALENSDPDLIILDVGLPWINGLDLCSDLRGDQRYRNTPILFLSAYGSEDDIARGLALGGNAYLTKPFDLPDLHRHLENLLQPQQQRADEYSARRR